jgi:anhydro-N-acetylmuramic acid kinase
VETFSAIGVMSGSSLDGLDIAYCKFERNNSWSFKVLKAETYPFPEEWRLILTSLPLKSQSEISRMDIEFGVFIGQVVNEFLKEDHLKPDLIASHGHTIFHAPEQGYTLQIGDGQTIANITGITTINDFRSKDIELGGQGAPLVPIGDALLFKEYDFCLNIGGIANISFDKKGKRLAFDICAANQLLNHLSIQLGAAFDKGGAFAQLGKLNIPLFDKLNNDPYFLQKPPKSLSNQYVQSAFIAMLETFSASVEDKLYTVVKHIAFQVNESVKAHTGRKILVTGGGAHNRFLIDAISMETNKEIMVPKNEIIDFKEAIIFAFMGVLRKLKEINCLASATGASQNCSGGVIYEP